MNRLDAIEAFEYLDELRESGRTNMFGASQYVERELGWERKLAREVTLLWMQSFSGDLTAEERVDNVLNK